MSSSGSHYTRSRSRSRSRSSGSSSGGRHRYRSRRRHRRHQHSHRDRSSRRSYSRHERGSKSRSRASSRSDRRHGSSRDHERPRRPSPPRASSSHHSTVQRTSPNRLMDEQCSVGESSVLDNFDPFQPKDYRDKIKTVHWVMKEKYPDLKWAPEHVESSGTVSVDAVKVKGTLSLPHSMVVPGLFEDYSKELRAEEGTKRGKSALYEVLPTGTLVNRPKVNLDSRYNVFDCPWNSSALTDPKIAGTSLYVSDRDTAEARMKDLPNMLLKTSQLRDWETANRELLNI